MNCPSSETLEQFLSGSSLDPAAVEAHVAACSNCRSASRSSYPIIRTCAPLGPALDASHRGTVGRPRSCVQVLTDAAAGKRRVCRQKKALRERKAIGPPGTYWVSIGSRKKSAAAAWGWCSAPYDRCRSAAWLQDFEGPKRSQESDPKARARLVHEAQAVARLRHDNVVTVHAVVNPPDDAPYLVMEYVEGGTLATLIRSQGRLDSESAAAILVQVADGLETAHAAGLIHRDIKPSNVLMDAISGRAKITDFGLSRPAERESGLTQDGSLAGTPTYMSPEQARGAADLDRRSDIYSLGVTLYEALTGTVPFHGVPHMVFQQVLSEEPRSPRLLNDRIPRDLETICLKAMAKEPGRRYQTSREIADDLRRWQRGEPIEARPVGRLERGWRACRRRPLVAGLTLAFLLAMTGGLAGISWKWAEAVSERRRTELERDRAVRNFRQAREAVDTYLTQVSDNDVLRSQNLEPLRRELLRTARDFYERFVQQDPDDPDLQADLARAHARLGQITSVLESTPRAIEHYQKMAAIFERLHKAYPQSAIYQKELAESDLKLGESFRTGAGPAAEAKAAFERGRMLYEDLVRAHPREPAFQHGLARSLRNLGHFSVFAMADHRHAEEALSAAREIYDRLPASYANQPTVQFDRALVYSNLAKLYSHTDRPDQHRSASEAAIAILEPLARTHVGNPDYMCYLADSLSELGDSYRCLAQPELAQATLEKAQSACEELATSHPANGYYQHLAADIAYSLASLHYHERHQPEQARVLFHRALDIEQQLATSFPAVAEYMFYLNNLLRDLRDWFGDLARLNAVRDHFKVAIAEYEARAPAENRDRERLNRFYMYCGETQFLLARYSEALADIKKGEFTELQLAAQAASSTPHTAWRIGRGRKGGNKHGARGFG